MPWCLRSDGVRSVAREGSVIGGVLLHGSGDVETGDDYQTTDDHRTLGALVVAAGVCNLELHRLGSLEDRLQVAQCLTLYAGGDGVIAAHKCVGADVE